MLFTNYSSCFLFPVLLKMELQVILLGVCVPVKTVFYLNTFCLFAVLLCWDFPIIRKNFILNHSFLHNIFIPKESVGSLEKECICEQTEISCSYVHRNSKYSREKEVCSIHPVINITDYRFRTEV